MTEHELNRVRDLRTRIRDLERHLQALRLSAANIVPIIDGLPHSTDISRRVEKLALKIVADERELDQLCEEFPHEQSHLLCLIMSEVDDPALQTLLILRYVDCCSFKEAARRMRYGLRHLYRLHKKFLQNVTPVSSCCTKRKLI